MNQSQSPNSRIKYRPYFTGEELGEIIHALKSSPSPKRQGIIKYLETFAVKIEHGIVAPSLVLESSLEEKLELSPPTGLSYQERRQLAYTKWTVNPTSCTPAEILLSQSFRYEEGLMSTEESASFEQSLGI